MIKIQVPLLLVGLLAFQSELLGSQIVSNDLSEAAHATLEQEVSYSEIRWKMIIRI